MRSSSAVPSVFLGWAETHYTAISRVKKAALCGGLFT
jgi:hypothetical protein